MGCQKESLLVFLSILLDFTNSLSELLEVVFVVCVLLL